ncbi:atg9p [Saccharomyces arboricola H-6]|uniref:Autophagy-related protein 9 n=1 Tax=Saccharomyces arboricola (strain H-6 / AS 2.3317 / CBS 10644) TaxID=1160507 RepID=J8PQG8_SACAR|nr:atg9p [Saccharomyces arboricola H-6]
MERDEYQQPNSHGKNTFLSRIFGLQSDEVNPSLSSQEMSNFPIPDIERGSSLLHSSSSNEDHGENDLRVPESDQGSSTEEEDEEDEVQRYTPQNGNGLVENHQLSVETGNGNAFGEEKSDLERLVEGSTDDSVPKIGQLSSDEEDNDFINNDGFEDDTPLFQKGGVREFGTKKSNATEEGQRPLFFRHILQNNYPQRNTQKLFTSSKASHYENDKNLGNDFSKTNRNAKNSAKYFGGASQPRFTGSSSNHINRFTKLFPLRKPNLLNNISVLNNTPEDRINTLSVKERALWKWANVENLDMFLQDVYNYYLGNGFYCIILEKILNIGTLLFVVFISTYMGHCIDYSKLPTSHQISDIIIDKCYSTNIVGFTKFFLWMFYFFVILKTVQLYFDVQKLSELQNFYRYLLNISDDELQTLPWQNVIQQLMYLKDQNAMTANVVEVKAKNRIDAHDVANRIMRRDNYLISLYNSDILDLSLPIPLFRTNVLTKTLEWNINLCVMGFVFNESGFIKQSVLKPSQREFTCEELQKRFMLAGFLNIILAPFLVTYFILLYFFRYFNEYKTSPGSIGARQYTPIAEWKFREYNELYHIFKKRMSLSTPLANKYVDQFPKEKTNLFLKFVSFISGSFVAILAFLTVFDPENFLNFEITSDRSVIFYITILGAIWSVSRNTITQEYHVFDPEETLKELYEYTHYLPKEWEGRYHKEEIKLEFCKLYNLRIVILLRELTSLMITPFVLWFSLPSSAGKIVDFFRENSEYVDGLGYVCKYAMFNVKDPDSKDSDSIEEDDLTKKTAMNGNHTSKNRRRRKFGVEDLGDKDMANNKMLQSYVYFMDDYSNNENLTGKYQLPIKRVFQNNEGDSALNNKYSWRKQFQPGQKPELFRIGKHALGPSNNNLPAIYSNRKPVKSWDNNNNGKDNDSGTNNATSNNGITKNNIDQEFELTESFLDSGAFPHYDGMNQNSMLNSHNNGNGILNKGGVLGLVKEYYKKSDVGR